MPKPAARRAHARNVAVTVAARPASVRFPAWATNAVGTVSESFFLSPSPSAAEGTGGHIVAVLFPGVGVADDFTEGRAKAAPSGAASLPKRGLWRAGRRRRACRLNRMFAIIIYPARGLPGRGAASDGQCAFSAAAGPPVLLSPQTSPENKC